MSSSSSCVVCVPVKCFVDCPFVDVLPGDPLTIREDSIVKANKLFEAFKFDYIKQSLIEAKSVDDKKALLDGWILQLEMNEKMVELYNLQDLVKVYEDSFGPLKQEEDQSPAVAAAAREAEILSRLPFL
ncbi:hypothetical protein Tco_1381388 [Tanacetum coccineum]